MYIYVYIYNSLYGSVVQVPEQQNDDGKTENWTNYYPRHLTFKLLFKNLHFIYLVSKYFLHDIKKLSLNNAKKVFNIKYLHVTKHV